MKILSFLFALLVINMMATVTQAAEIMKYQKLSDVPTAKWQELSRKKIFFGHQSVGFNIIDGMKAIMEEHPEIHLNIIESRKGEEPSGAFMHARVGENRKPETKIEDFVNVIDKELGTIPDMAALKFCFVDANDSVDVNKVFAEYRQAMARLKKERPGLTLIHFTMPLRTQPVSWKTKVKLMMGKAPWEFKDNIKRNHYNQLLLQQYQGKEPVFDIAAYEATRLDNKKETFNYKEKKYLAM